MIRLVTAIIAFIALPMSGFAQVGITFTFANGEVTGTGPTYYEFDVMAQGTATGTNFGDGLVYVNYSSAGFGDNITGNPPTACADIIDTDGATKIGKSCESVDVTLGDLVNAKLAPGAPYYNMVNVIDNATNRVAVTIERAISEGFTTELPTAPTSILHFKMLIADENQTAGLSFDTELMIGQQFYADQATKYTPVIAIDTDDMAFLPVEFVAFDATLDGTDVLLQWSTASETNNAGFDIEFARVVSDDVIGAADVATELSWESLGFIDGNGTTTRETDYTYRAPSIEYGTYKFRLKQVDFDGAFDYSNEVELTVEVPGDFVLGNPYPNPFNPQTQFTLAVREQQSVRIEAFDTIGRKVSTLYDGELAPNESHRFRVDGSNLASGLYIVRAVGENFVASKAITLLK